MDTNKEVLKNYKSLLRMIKKIENEHPNIISKFKTKRTKDKYNRTPYHCDICDQDMSRGYWNMHKRTKKHMELETEQKE